MTTFGNPYDNQYHATSVQTGASRRAANKNQKQARNQKKAKSKGKKVKRGTKNRVKSGSTATKRKTGKSSGGKKKRGKKKSSSKGGLFCKHPFQSLLSMYLYLLCFEQVAAMVVNV